MMMIPGRRKLEGEREGAAEPGGRRGGEKQQRTCIDGGASLAMRTTTCVDDASASQESLPSPYHPISLEGNFGLRAPTKDCCNLLPLRGHFSSWQAISKQSLAL